MKLSHNFKIGVIVGIGSLAGIALFQNFTSQQQAQIYNLETKAKTLQANLVTNNPISTLFKNCTQAGTSSDTRPVDQQFKCNEYPIGSTNRGISPKTYSDFLIGHPLSPTQAQLVGRAIPDDICQSDDSRGSSCLAEYRLAKEILANLPAKPVAQECDDSRSCTSNNAKKLKAYEALKNFPNKPALAECEDSRTCTSNNRTIMATYNAAKNLVDAQTAAYQKENSDKKALLDQWNADKTLVSQNIPYTDRANKSRSIPFLITIKRDVVISTANVVVGTPASGQKNFGTQTISKVYGHHFYHSITDGTNKYIAGCNYFPGMTVQGHTFSADYTLFEKWWGSYSITLTLNPGTFKFNNLETCNLLKVNPLQINDKKIELIGLKAPRFNGASLSGLYIDLDIGIFGWFVVALIAGISMFLPGVGPLIGTALVAGTYLLTNPTYLSAAAQNYANNTVLNDLSSGSGQYSTTEAWDKLLNNVNTSQSNVQTGNYIKDITLLSALRTTVIPAIQEQMKMQANIENLKAQYLNQAKEKRSR